VSERPAPHELCYQAVEEVGNLDDREAVGRRYRELLTEHGHLVPGTPKPLPCGWAPGRGRPDDPRQPQLALSVWQPWAYLLVTGIKDVENRSWATKHRRRLWIHASKRLDEDAYRALDASGVHLPEHLPRGALVGAVELVGCVRDSPSRWAEPGQWHWQIGQHWALPEPIKMRGRQGLFWVDRELAAA
jgi:hypothetical protein